MGFTPIEVDRKNLAIMGVTFPDLKTLEGVAHALGSNMYENFRPTKRDIELIRDRRLGKISPDQVLEILIGEANGKQ
jgi:putative transcriptional regulator